jgi:hypothetical protein
MVFMSLSSHTVWLKQQLEQYLQELPVVGFNTGKYDVNAMKVDFFTRLVDRLYRLTGITFRNKADGLGIGRNVGTYRHAE